MLLLMMLYKPDVVICEVYCVAIDEIQQLHTKLNCALTVKLPEGGWKCINTCKSSL